MMEQKINVDVWRFEKEKFMYQPGLCVSPVIKKVNEIEDIFRFK